VPKTCPGVPSELLNPEKAWNAEGASFKDSVKGLAELFVKNMSERFSETSDEVIKAGPTL